MAKPSIDELEDAIKSASSGLEAEVDSALTRLGYNIDVREDGKYLSDKDHPEGKKLPPFHEWAFAVLDAYLEGLKDPFDDGKSFVQYGGIRREVGETK